MSGEPEKGTPSEKDQLLLKAAEDGDTAKIEALLAAGSNIDALDPVTDFFRGNDTPLTKAIYHEREDAALLLIDRGADVRVAKGEWKQTMLHHACTMLLEPVVQRLITAGVDLDAEDSRGFTPFHVLFYEAGPLELQESIAMRLLQAGATFDIKNAPGRTVMHSCIRNGLYAAFYRMVELGGDINLLEEDGESFLHSAARRNDVELARFLLEKGTSINHHNTYKDTAVHIAVYTHNLAMLELLLQYEPDLTLCDRSQQNPLTAL
jgi:uncharacterized protein